MTKKSDIVKEFLASHEPGAALVYVPRSALYDWDHHVGEIAWVRFLAKKYYVDKAITEYQYNSWHYPKKEVLANFERHCEADRVRVLAEIEACEEKEKLEMLAAGYVLGKYGWEKPKNG